MEEVGHCPQVAVFGTTIDYCSYDPHVVAKDDGRPVLQKVVKVSPRGELLQIPSPMMEMKRMAMLAATLAYPIYVETAS